MVLWLAALKVIMYCWKKNNFKGGPYFAICLLFVLRYSVISKPNYPLSGFQNSIIRSSLLYN